MNKIGSFATIAGLVMVGLQSSIYTVDPGEKALIMDNIQGLKQKVYDQGYHLYIPFIQVFTHNKSFSIQLFMIVD
jgi:uncharacterized protein YcgL (UPF0745 family)